MAFSINQLHNGTSSGQNLNAGATVPQTLAANNRQYVIARVILDGLAGGANTFTATFRNTDDNCNEYQTVSWTKPSVDSKSAAIIGPFLARSANYQMFVTSSSGSDTSVSVQVTYCEVTQADIRAIDSDTSHPGTLNNWLNGLNSVGDPQLIGTGHGQMGLDYEADGAIDVNTIELSGITVGVVGGSGNISFQRNATVSTFASGGDVNVASINDGTLTLAKFSSVFPNHFASLSLSNGQTVGTSTLTQAQVNTEADQALADAKAGYAAAIEAAILDEGDATALLAAIAAKVEEFLINEGDATATIAAIATACNAAITSAHGSGSYVRNTEPLDASGVRSAIGLGSANLDTQLSGIATSASSAATSSATGVTQTTAAAIRAAVGLGSANLDVQLSGISSGISGLSIPTASQIATQVLTSAQSAPIYAHLRTWLGTQPLALSSQKVQAIASGESGAGTADQATLLLVLEQAYAIVAQTDKITTSQLAVISAMARGAITLKQGDSYIASAEDGSSLTFPKPEGSTRYPDDMTGWTVTLEAKAHPDNTNEGLATLSTEMTINDPAGARSLTITNLDSDSTAALRPGLWTFDFRAVNADQSEERTLISGPMKVDPTMEASEE